jgi:hypothetical protein
MAQKISCTILKINKENKCKAKKREKKEIRVTIIGKEPFIKKMLTGISERTMEY